MSKLIFCFPNKCHVKGIVSFKKVYSSLWRIEDIRQPTKRERLEIF